jgi:hypothetical protein
MEPFGSLEDIRLLVAGPFLYHKDAGISSLFLKNKSRLMRSPCCLSVSVPPNTGRQTYSHRNQYTYNSRKTVGRSVSYTVRVVSNLQ